jgi:hypothetical protein
MSVTGGATDIIICSIRVFMLFDPSRSFDERSASGLEIAAAPLELGSFHVAFGLDPSAPNWIVGVGYSFPLDHLFAANK